MEQNTQLWRLWDRRTHEASGGGECMALAGCERRRQGEGYDWYGLERGGDQQRPILLLQYSLSNGGAFQSGTGREQDIPAGHLMVAIIPSRHRYRLAPGHNQWSFTWLILRHPFAVERVAQACAGTGMLLDLQQAADVRNCYEHVWRSVLSGGLDNPHDREAALVNCALMLSRAIEQPQANTSEAERLRLLLNQAAECGGNSVADLARAAGYSRSAFSHRCARLIGMSPAAYLRQRRLAAVAQELRASDTPLQQLAQRHGFADATHLGKAFRQHYHLSPGAWRRLGE